MKLTYSSLSSLIIESTSTPSIRIQIIKYSLLLSSLLCFANVSLAGVITVMNTNDSGAESLRDAVINSPAGDTIIFDVSTNGNIIQLNNDILIFRDITIIGNDTTNTILDGMANSRIFDVESSAYVIINGITIQNGSMEPSGGGGIRNRGKLSLRDCLIQNNGGALVSKGGGISNTGVLTLTNCSLQNNEADLSLSSSLGGAIYNTGDSLSIEACRIINNRATRQGAGIYSFSSTAAVVKIDSSVIADNTIIPVGTNGGNFSGAGIYNNSNSDMLITQSTISNNSLHTGENNQQAQGGGIYNGGKLTLLYSEVTENETFSQTTISRGGGIYNNNSIIRIENSKIISNTSSSNTTSVNINALASGGGIYSLGESAELTILNSTIAGNTVSVTVGRGHGAGIFTILGKGTLTNTVISGNYINAPTSEGIGMYVDRAPSYIELINVTNTGNKATATSASGGGLYAKNTTIDITNSIIANTSFNGLDADIRSISSTINDLGNNHIFSPDGSHGITTGNDIDPLFVMDVDTTGGIATTSGDLRLRCGSPGINAGTTDTTGLNLGLVDIAGLPRIQGSAVDIGAYEKALPCTELSDCSQVNISLDSLLLSNSDPISLFRAQMEVKSKATMDRDVILKAGDAILFEKLFEINNGTALESIIEKCSN